jgi:S-adenosylmethionine hydrolase
MAVITLTTDMGLKDHYDAVVKGTILREAPDVRIIDITHQVPPFDITGAAFVLRNAYPEFPEGSIHIVGVDPDLEPGKQHLLARYRGHYFIAADNGVLPMVFDHEAPESMVRIHRELSEKDIPFPTKGVFARIAARLVLGEAMSSFGEATGEYVDKRSHFKPVVDGNTLRGTVIHIDSYDNAITNIDRELFEEVAQDRPFTIRFRASRNAIHRISEHYNEVTPGENVALFSSSGYLEVAINRGAPGVGEGARPLLGLKLYDSVQIEFHDRTDR